MITHRFLHANSALRHFVTEVPFVVDAVEAAVEATRVALNDMTPRIRRQGFADVVRLHLAEALESSSWPDGCRPEISVRNSVSLKFGDGEVRIRILKASADGRLPRPTSRARRAEMYQILALPLDMAPQRLTLQLLWQVTELGVELTLVLPKAAHERSRYVDEHWSIRVPDAATLAMLETVTDHGEDDVDLDNIERRGDKAAEGDDLEGDDPA